MHAETTMSKSKSKKSTRAGWARYPKEMTGVRLSDELHAALHAHPDVIARGISAHVRDLLAADCGLPTAKTASQSDAQSA
jgi:hypothetical protein